VFSLKNQWFGEFRGLPEMLGIKQLPLCQRCKTALQSPAIGA
jgi:hypothetical protein